LITNVFFVIDTFTSKAASFGFLVLITVNSPFFFDGATAYLPDLKSV